MKLKGWGLDEEQQRSVTYSSPEVSLSGKDFDYNHNLMMTYGFSAN